MGQDLSLSMVVLIRVVNGLNSIVLRGSFSLFALQKTLSDFMFSLNLPHAIVRHLFLFLSTPLLLPTASSTPLAGAF